MIQEGVTDRFRASPIVILFTLLIFGISVYARVWDLGWHFTNVDDIGIPEHIITNYEKHNPFIIPELNTNAPLQFLFTRLLVNPEQSYREVVFWSRLPSCVAGILGLLGLIFYYFRYDRLRSFQVCIALILFGFSWENIAFAKQANDYAAGCSAVIFLYLIFLLYSKEIPSLEKLLLMAVLLALTNSVQYSTFIFIPAVYIGLFLRSIELTKRNPLCSVKRITASFLASGLTYLLCIFPIWHYFLQYRLGKGTPTYAMGPQGEFLFSTEGITGIAGKIGYFFWFYAKNFFIVFQTRIGFVPEHSGLYYFFSGFFFVLFIAGIVSFFIRKSEILQRAGIFIGISFLTWFLLIYFQKLTLSPTRHTLLFLPVFAIITAEGFGLLTEKFLSGGRPDRFVAAGKVLQAIFILGCAAIFLSNYGKFLNERRDPIVEEEIIDILKQYHVTEVLIDKRSIGIRFMKKLQKFQKEIGEYEGDHYGTIARITRFPTEFTWEGCENDRTFYNQMLAKSGYQEHAVHPCKEYEIIYKKEFNPGSYVEFSDECGIDILRNQFYMYVVRLKKGHSEETRNQEL